MPIDKDGIIYSEEKQKKNKISVKDVCLLITTCISIIAPIVMIYQSKIQKLQYERSIQELELEKTKYENMLKENSIYIKSSYIICHVDYIKDLFDDLKEEGNVRILDNDITKVFYDEKKKTYIKPKDIKKNENLQEYDYLYPEVVFLKIESVSNRTVRNIDVNFIEIETNNNRDGRFRSFGCITQDECDEYGKDVNFKVGDIDPNDIILIPVFLQFSEGGDAVDYESTDIEHKYLVFDYKESIYKKIYIPQNITCYDDFYEEDKKFEIRDMNDTLITKFYYEELG